MDVDDQLQALERRVAALERDRAATESAGALGNGNLWAIDALAARVDAPGAVMLAGSVDLPNGQHPVWQETRPTPGLLDAELPQVAEVLAALANPVRLRLLRAVIDGKTTVQDMAATDGIGTTGQVYHHLRQLTATGWLRRTGGGAYEIPVARIVPLLGAILCAQI